MKKPETTVTFVMICIVALVAAYGVGDSIKEIKASRRLAAQNKILKTEMKKIESYSPGNENTFTQNRNTRTGTQDFGPRSNMMGGFGNQGMNNREIGMFDGFSPMGMQNTTRKTEEPNKTK